MEVVKKKLSAWRIIGRVFSLLGVTLLALVIVLFGVVWVLEKGPSPYVTEMFCRSTRETSAIRWIPSIFLSEEEIAQYKSENTEEITTETVNTSLIHISEEAEIEEAVEEYLPTVELVEISVGTVKGKMIIVRDPSLVRLGISGEFGYSHSGLQLTEIVAKYNGIGGVNAGGFNDEGGRGNGGRPQGLVIYEGELIWGKAQTLYNVIGLDNDHILHVGTMTGQEALDEGITDGVSFVTHDGLASSLIINGVVQTQNLSSGLNPRTAIGQCSDGTILLMVLDGRSINTLGASMEDIVNVMLSYGAVNCGNLDGGSSSVMAYDGEIVNACSSVTGPRSVPTAFVVLSEEES